MEGLDRFFWKIIRRIGREIGVVYVGGEMGGGRINVGNDERGSNMGDGVIRGLKDRRIRMGIEEVGIVGILFWGVGMREDGRNGIVIRGIGIIS